MIQIKREEDCCIYNTCSDIYPRGTIVFLSHYEESSYPKIYFNKTKSNQQKNF